jgi:hypothetical protein
MLPPAARSAQRAEEQALLESVVEAAEGDEAAELPNLPQQRLAKSSAMQTDVRQFQDDLRDGKLDPIWMQAAMNASARRHAGEFDEWRKSKIEETWGLGSTASSAS